MARYIDAEKLLEELQEELDFETPMYTEEQNKYFNSGLRCAIRNVKKAPTADVVPKSEVEKIFEEIENRAFGFGACFVEMTRTTFDEIKKKYTKESEDKE